MRSADRAVALAALVAACLGCEPADESVDVTVDTFNTALAGAFLPYEDERRQPIADAMAALGSDVVCLQEVWRQSDKELIAEAAAATFPYAVFFEHDLDTLIDDPRDQSGSIPEALPGPPCAETSLAETLDEALACIAEHCSTVPGSEEGMTTSTDCAQEHCVAYVSSLLMGDEASARCYACLVTPLPTETIGDIRDLCTTEQNGGLAFRGQNGVMILSRHPVADARVVVWPGTWNRRVLLQGTVELPDEAAFDVYCTHLTPEFDAPTYPYTGQYGEGHVNYLGWAAEQLLQAERLVEDVEAGSGSEPAVILGDFNSGRSWGELSAEGEATMDALEAAFARAGAEGYDPACTYCVENPVNDTEHSRWIDHIFVGGSLDGSEVGSVLRTFDDAVVPVDGDPSMVPLSDHYGLRATIAVPR